MLRPTVHEAADLREVHPSYLLRAHAHHLWRLHHVLLAHAEQRVLFLHEAVQPRQELRVLVDLSPLELPDALHHNLFGLRSSLITTLSTLLLLCALLLLLGALLLLPEVEDLFLLVLGHPDKCCWRGSTEADAGKTRETRSRLEPTKGLASGQKSLIALKRMKRR